MRERIFSEEVGINLFDLVYFRQYPLHPTVSKNCFLDSLKDLGVNVVCNDSSKEVNLATTLRINRGWSEVEHKVLTALAYSDLGKGKSIYPENSLKAFEDGIYNLWQPTEVMDDKDLAEFREIGTKKQEEFRELMRSHILPYLVKYQEHMLIPVSGEISVLNPTLTKPKILLDMLKECPHIKLGKEFWTLYLDRLCQEKGYPLKKEGNRLERIRKDGNFALEDGTKIWSDY